MFLYFPPPLAFTQDFILICEGYNLFVTRRKARIIGYLYSKDEYSYSSYVFKEGERSEERKEGFRDLGI